MPRRSRSTDTGAFRPYVPVARRAHDAAHTLRELQKQGHVLEPVVIEGMVIARTFWGKAWCAHFESLSDFATRLPRGRSYLRSRAVLHLALEAGSITAKVRGSALYDIRIEVAPLPASRWQNIIARCTGNIDSWVELLRGKLSAKVMEVVTNAESGLFPRAAEITMACSCPDSARLCKHLAAVLYGVGARLDEHPELLFTLRGVDAHDLIHEGASLGAPPSAPAAGSARRLLASDALADVFGIDFAPTTGRPALPERVASAKPPVAKSSSKRAAPKSTAPKSTAPKVAAPRSAAAKRSRR